jgi:prevent-host-death family protein
MIEIAAFDARDKFSRLLDRVQLGEEVIITRRGKPVAKLIPEHPSQTDSSQEQEQIHGIEAYQSASSNSH